MPITPEHRQDIRFAQQLENGHRFRPNPFLTFRQHFIRVTGSTNQTAITRVAAQWWNNMTEAARAPYHFEAVFVAEVLNIAYNRPERLGNGLILQLQWEGDNFFSASIVRRD